MNLTFGSNIKITICNRADSPEIEVTIAGLPAGVDLEKEDFKKGPLCEEPQFGEGRLLCKDGSFITDGRPFTITFRSGKVANAIAAAGVMARHIIAPIRIGSISGSAGECLCTCMPAGMQLERAFRATSELFRIECAGDGMKEGLSDGEPLRVKICLPANDGFAENADDVAEAVVAMALADALFF